MQDAHRRRDCRLCRSLDLVPAIRLTPTPLADSYVPQERLGEAQEIYDLDYELCRNCGFVQLSLVVRPKVIYVDYIYETRSSLGLAEHFDRYADEVSARVAPPAGSLVIDLGSNDGTLLSSFQRRGFRVLGIDPAREIAQSATARGIETLAEFFTPDLATRIALSHGRAGIITANNLFANVDDLFSMTEGIRTVLAEDGVFVFESFYLADLVRNMVFDFLYHEHISCFAVRPVERFFASQGLELIDVVRVPTKGGSLRYTIQRENGPRRRSDSVDTLIAEEDAMGLASIATYQAFERRIDESRMRIVDAIDRLAPGGRKIAGFGASATTTTFLYHFGLGERLEFIADEYEAKQGLYSPGFHVPVVPPRALEERMPKAVLVIAWRYAAPILEKNRGYSSRGGRFIVPLPEVRIV